MQELTFEQVEEVGGGSVAVTLATGWAGLVAGAAAGSIVPGWGTLAGAIAGGVVGIGSGIGFSLATSGRDLQRKSVVIKDTE